MVVMVLVLLYRSRGQGHDNNEVQKGEVTYGTGIALWFLNVT